MNKTPVASTWLRRRLETVVRSELDVTCKQLLEYIAPAGGRVLVLSARTLLLLAERSPKGWLRQQGLSFVGGQDLARLLVAPSWIVYGGGSYVFLAADTHALFDLMSKPVVQRDTDLLGAAATALFGALAVAPAAVWPGICGRLPSLDQVAFRALAPRVARMLPTAIKRSPRGRQRKLVELREALGKRREKAASSGLK